MRTKITKRTVDAAKPGRGDVFIWDTDTKGFGLKVTPAGNKVYIVQARLKGHLRRWTIGKHGSPWTPDKAREEAVAHLGQIARGNDPSAEKTRAKRDISIKQLCELYVLEGCTTKKPSTLKVEAGLIERHIKPLLGKRRLQELSRADIERFLRDVAGGKTATDEKTGKRGRAIVRGGKGTANRTTDLLASMLTFAVDRGLRPDNPARGVKKFRLQQRERFLTAKELAKLGDALSAAEQAYRDAEARRARGGPMKSGRKGEMNPPSGENPYAIAAIRLLMLTGCRKTEILSLKWDWVDFERGLLRLPDSKTGAKPVVVAAPALEVLQSLPRIDGNPHVIPGSTKNCHFVGLQKVWARVRGAAGLPDLRLHDLRHSFASVGVAGGDSLYIVGKVLGHSQARTTQRYAHLADDPVRTAANRISERISAAMHGDAEANIISISAER